MPAIAVNANGIDEAAPSETTATPQSPVDSSTSTGPAKRKRASTEDAPHTNGTSEPATDTPDAAVKELPPRSLLTDLLTVLSNYDTTPSILTSKLPSDRPAQSVEPTAKRTKLSQPPAATIADKLKTFEYTDLDALVKDVDAVATALIAPLKAKEGNVPTFPSGRPTMLSPVETKLWTAVLAFQKLLGDIVHAETQSTASRHAQKPVKKDSPMANGITVKMESDDDEVLQNGDSILTVFANAQVPKQLFSSFQRPVHVNASNKLAAAVDVVTPLRDTGLPNFISTTDIPAIELEDTKAGKEKALKIGELFAPPTTLPRLQPPKLSKKMTTSSNNLTFVPHDKLTRKDRRNSYNWCAAKQTVGQWLGYGGIDAPQEPTTPSAIRKQRARTLSTGEAIVLSESEKAALKQAKEDALFRKVYGGFAPGHDNSNAVVPEETRNEIWWNKLGERFAQKAVLIDPALLGEDVAEGAMDEDTDELVVFKEVVDSFDAEKLGLATLHAERKEEKETDEILEEISNGLETLASYQRVRNSHLATSASTTVGQNSPLTKLMGSPSTPSAAEVELYKTLEAQLKVMILNLPPYAVARLNGDQLDELNIKTSIIVETENTRGILAEDEASRVSKQQAFAAATGPAVPQLNRAPSSNSYSSYSGSNQFNRTPAATPSTRPQSYYPQQTGSARPAPNLAHRSSSGVQTYSAGYPTTAQRPPYQQQGYNQSTPRGGYQQAQPGSNPYLQQLHHVAGAGGKPGYNSQYGGGYPGTPQAQSQSRASYQQTPASAYPASQRGVASQYNYPASQSPAVRTASPLTAGTGAPPSAYNQQPRPSYSTATAGTTGTPSQTRSSYYPTAAGGSQPGQYNTPNTTGTGGRGGGGGGNAVGPSGFHSSMSASEQQTMLNRVQQQQQAQMRAQSQAQVNPLTPSRQGSGTPQPPVPGYNAQGVAAQSS